MNSSITIASLCIDIEQQLLTIYGDPTLCRQYAWWTLEHILNARKAQLIAQHTIALTPAQQTTLNHWLDQLITHKIPIQYLIGSVPFCDATILVEPPTLIPRPETEEWCSTLIGQLKKLPPEPLSILDLCSGSGCIAIALARALPSTTVYAADISPKAIALTEKNIAYNEVTNVHVIRSDLFTGLDQQIKYDLIVSNPPYIPEHEWTGLDPSVKQWEDYGALCAPDNGLAIIKKIISMTPTYLTKPTSIIHATIPSLVIEIDHTQGPSVRALLYQEGYTNVVITKDLEGKDRVATATAPSSGAIPRER